MLRGSRKRLRRAGRQVGRWAGRGDYADLVICEISQPAYLPTPPTCGRRSLMKLTELFLSELDREADRSRHALEQMPDGKADWKPHDRSMVFGYLSELVATMPAWIAMQVTGDEFDLKPAGGSQWKREP